MLYKDGRFYKGSWLSDLYHGKGILKLTSEPNSMIVEGNFENGKFIGGLSKCQYPNGEIYEGKMT